jgi:two-component system, chemotaxis family, protein-glutamate methylesterase/glutaminase
VIHRLIVVGASFGGFDALKVLLGGIPATFPVPLAIVQHQASAGAGLATLLQRYTSLIVVEAEDKDVAQPGHAYVAPPGYHLLVEDGTLALSVDAPVLHARPSIDVLFESAADAYGPGVAGVILTGTGQDGAAGLGRIKRGGGLTIVQHPATAERAAMPLAAMAATAVDLVLPLDEIGPRLAQLYQSASPGPKARPPGPSPAPTFPLAPESPLTRR